MRSNPTVLNRPKLLFIPVQRMHVQGSSLAVVNAPSPVQVTVTFVNHCRRLCEPVLSVCWSVSGVKVFLCTCTHTLSCSLVGLICRAPQHTIAQSRATSYKTRCLSILGSHLAHKPFQVPCPCLDLDAPIQPHPLLLSIRSCLLMPVNSNCTLVHCALMHFSVHTNEFLQLSSSSAPTCIRPAQILHQNNFSVKHLSHIGSMDSPIPVDLHCASVQSLPKSHVHLQQSACVQC